MASNYIECKDCGHIRLDHKGAKTGGKCEKKNCNCKGFAATYKQIKNPTKLKLQKYDVTTSTGKKFQIIAASREQALRMVAKAVPGAIVNSGRKKNPTREYLQSGKWTPAHAIRIRKGRLEIMR